MWRNILAVIAGVVAGSLVIGLVEMVGHQVVPPPAGMDASNMESIKQAMAQMQPAAFFAILVAWALGAFTSGWVAGSISVRQKLGCALVAGGLIQLSGVATMVMIPHPLWFWVVSMLLPLPAAWLGSRLALGRSARPIV